MVHKKKEQRVRIDLKMKEPKVRMVFKKMKLVKKRKRVKRRKKAKEKIMEKRKVKKNKKRRMMKLKLETKKMKMT